MSILLATCCPIFTQEAHPEEHSHLVIGYTPGAYQVKANKDIRAAITILTNKIAWKYFEKSTSLYYDNLDDMASDMLDGTIQVACLPSEDLLQLRKRSLAEPLLITSTSSGREMELLLLVREDSGIRTLDDLHGKTIAISKHPLGSTSIFHIWLETMLMARGHSKMDSFFSSIKEFNVLAKVVMPVFFRKADACVVTRHVFNLTTELNPQIGKQLAIIASIENLSQGIVAVDRRLPEQTKKKIRESFLSLNDSPEGKQLIMLFQVSTISPYRKGDLKTTEELFSKYQRLKKTISRR